MDEKTCPLANVFAGTDYDMKESFLCGKGNCQWWTNHYTVEGRQVWDCAITLLAKRNSEGLIEP